VAELAFHFDAEVVQLEGAVLDGGELRIEDEVGLSHLQLAGAGAADAANTLPYPKRPHQSLDGATPDQAYFTALPSRAAANPGSTDR